MTNILTAAGTNSPVSSLGIMGPVLAGVSMIAAATLGSDVFTQEDAKLITEHTEAVWYNGSAIVGLLTGIYGRLRARVGFGTKPLG